MFGRKTWYISADFADVFISSGIIWVVNRFMLGVYMYFADKESIGCCLLVLSIKYLFLHVLAQWYYFSKSLYCS